MFLSGAFRTEGEGTDGGHRQDHLAPFCVLQLLPRSPLAHTYRVLPELWPGPGLPTAREGRHQECSRFTSGSFVQRTQ